jgi:mono/diheme cytochrome c family protein
MAEYFLLGLYHEATPTVDTIDKLRELGVEDEKITVMSGIPYQPEILGRRQTYQRLVPIALIGAISGLISSLFLTVGTPILYPIAVGGQPNIPIPPSIIIIFEFTMLGAIVATFAGMIAESRFPRFGQQVYDFRITEGHIGILAQMDEALVDKAQAILEENGAHHIKREEIRLERPARPWLRWAFIVTFLFVPTVIGLLFTYAVIAVPLPDQMVDQQSVAYEQGPRLAAPGQSVPIQGQALMAGQPATLPLPATDASLQNGQTLFSIVCVVCHGADGKGNGNLASFFTPHPSDLTGEVAQQLSDADIFLVLTQGRGLMPSLAENLSVADRWDVINFVRSLKQ